MGGFYLFTCCWMEDAICEYDMQFLYVTLSLSYDDDTVGMRFLSLSLYLSLIILRPLSLSLSLSELIYLSYFG
jgi:hypothetical protein